MFRRSGVSFMTAYGVVRVGRENLVSTLRVRPALETYLPVVDFAALRVETLRASCGNASVPLQPYKFGRTAATRSATVRADRVSRRKPEMKTSAAAQRNMGAEKRRAAATATTLSGML